MSYSDIIYTISDNSLDVFKTKQEANKFYSTCYCCSNGTEQERYASVLNELKFSNVGKDNISKTCNKINIKSKENIDKFITINLERDLSIEDVIKYYEEIISPILKVSEEYGVDFNSAIPFEDFASDDNSYTNISFTEYYKEILEKNNIEMDSICTNSWSDGKYNLIVNGNEFRLTAWDNLNAVIDNVDAIVETLKEKQIQVEISK